MSSYYSAVNNQQGLEGVDPLTGLPKKKKTTAYNPSQVGLGSFAGKAADNTAAGALGGILGGGGFGSGPVTPGVPNYRALIDNDPLYSQAKLDFGAQGVSDAAQRAALTQRALTLFGQVPDNTGLAGLNPEWLNQDISPESRLLAQQNTDSGLSVVARQAKAFKDQVRQIRNALAARGGLQSGELGHQLQDAQLGYDQAKFDTTAELADFLSGLQRGYAESQRTLRDKQAAAAEAAAGRVQAQYPAGAGAPIPAYQTAAPAPAAPPPIAPQTGDLYDTERARGRGAQINDNGVISAYSDLEIALRKLGLTPGSNP